ncbi:23S rRNA (guanosine(2251)-2'-O)-methyltransferase RlmB [Sodalis-like secondary symbiont of Drepanosiphum platanoidis]|uniref:23S rRNA (guanosine(2251)-2'-O)-methyltransferase RlmB n=1 Tax=Sodalis-like secondary symbiont of Drepanosiphum platanoidis TaxID=2994493 RepID=UPI003464D798
MNKFVYGIHAIEAILKNNPKKILKVYFLQKKKLNNILLILKKNNIPIKIVSNKWINFKTKNSIHQGILAKIKNNKEKKQKNILLNIINKKNPLILILDGITDNRNFGACIRSAYAAGVDLIIFPKNRSARINAISKKSSSGADEYIKIIQVINISRVIKFLKENNIEVIGTDINAKKNIFQKKLNIPLAFVIGSEENGIRFMIKNHCNDIIKIPMISSINSLNVSVACGIILFETIRQRFFL